MENIFSAVALAFLFAVLPLGLLISGVVVQFRLWSTKRVKKPLLRAALLAVLPLLGLTMTWFGYLEVSGHQGAGVYISLWLAYGICLLYGVVGGTFAGGVSYLLDRWQGGNRKNNKGV